MNAADSAFARRRVYSLLITLAAAAVAGRILCAELVLEPSLHRVENDPDDHRRPWPPKRPKPMPTFSSNDRSRWATIRALVENGTYAVGQRKIDPVTRKYTDSGIIFEDGYGSVDKVLDPKTLEFYSSKPPLLTTILAGEYWLLRQCGLSLEEEDRWVVVRLILFTVNWLPLVIYLVLLGRLVERFGASDWGRFFVLAAGGFATLVTLFSISINNHSVAACTALMALYLALGIWSGEKTAAWRYVLSGFCAGLTASFELPAAALLATLFLLLLWRAPWKTLACFAPAAALPVAAFLVTNYLAVGQLRPVQSEFGSPWYDYPGSHWKKPEPGEEKFGIDWARQKESRADYAFHYFLGHHGLFSLSPIYLLALAGMVIGLLRRRRKGEAGAAPETSRVPFFLFPLALLLTVVVVGFYLVKTDNYGGWTNGLRWLMWLTPFWLLTMLPVADRLAESRWGRGLAYLLLAVSVISVNYRSWNPWRMPWLYDFMEALGWPGY
jgi:hypothetical protein